MGDYATSSDSGATFGGDAQNTAAYGDSSPSSSTPSWADGIGNPSPSAPAYAFSGQPFNGGYTAPAQPMSTAITGGETSNVGSQADISGMSLAGGISSYAYDSPGTTQQTSASGYDPLSSIWGMSSQASSIDGSGFNISLSPQERDMTIRTIAAEANASNDSYAAVGSVIFNRTMVGLSGIADPLTGMKYPATVAGVIAQRSQFTGYNNRNYQSVDPASPQYQSIGAVVDGLLSGAVQDPTSGATAYFAPGLPGLAPWTNPNTPGTFVGKPSTVETRVGTQRFFSQGVPRAGTVASAGDAPASPQGPTPPPAASPHGQPGSPDPGQAVPADGGIFGGSINPSTVMSAVRSLGAIAATAPGRSASIGGMPGVYAGAQRRSQQAHVQGAPTPVPVSNSLLVPDPYAQPVAVAATPAATVRFQALSHGPLSALMAIHAAVRARAGR